MQNQDLDKHEGFCWAFQDELMLSWYVEVEKNYIDPDTEYYARLGEGEYPNRFDCQIAGFCLEKIRPLKNEEYITLLEAALLIGERLKEAIHWFIADAPMIFAIAIEQGEIDPREPWCLMPYSKIQHLPEREEYVLYGRWKEPSTIWKITPKEAAEFAILKGYPEHLFTDLLSDTPADSMTASELSPSSGQTAQDYLDENHPLFSQELSIANEVWEHVLSKNPAKPKTGSRKKLIIDYLDKHHGDLSIEAKIRIATMLNPDKSGGAPRSND